MFREEIREGGGGSSELEVRGLGLGAGMCLGEHPRGVSAPALTGRKGKVAHGVSPCFPLHGGDAMRYLMDDMDGMDDMDRATARAAPTASETSEGAERTHPYASGSTRGAERGALGGWGHCSRFTQRHGDTEKHRGEDEFFCIPLCPSVPLCETIEMLPMG